MGVVRLNYHGQQWNQVQGDLKDYCYILQKLILRTGFFHNQRYFAIAQYDKMIKVMF